MNISEEISKLAELREKGILSPEEFEQAKKKILSSEQGPRDYPPRPPAQKYRFDDRNNDSFGKAANRYVSFRIIMGVVGFIIFILFFVPMMCSSSSPFNSQPSMNFQPNFPR